MIVPHFRQLSDGEGEMSKDSLVFISLLSLFFTIAPALKGGELSTYLT